MEKDLQEIIRVINDIKSNINISLYNKEGIELNERLRREYLEIQQMHKLSVIYHLIVMEIFK